MVCVQQAQEFLGGVGLLLYGSPQHVISARPPRAGIQQLDSWLPALTEIPDDLGVMEDQGREEGKVSLWGTSSLFERAAETPGIAAEFEGHAQVVKIRETPTDAFIYRDRDDGRSEFHSPTRIIVASPLYIQFRH